MFSRRLPWPAKENRLSALLRDRRRSGSALLDLTESNPTRVGLAHPDAEIAAALSAGAPGAYAPEARGLEAARREVAQFCARRGQAASPDRMVLTASTSEAYALLFKMLGDPGDRILVPQPSYPLFDYLAALESVRCEPCPMAFDGGFAFDPKALERALEADDPCPVRAVVVVSPNNPTGTILDTGDRRALDRLCAARPVAVIDDAVFRDYRFEPGAAISDPGVPASLTFTLGGLSKACGLPQMKLGWILVDGPPLLVSEALERLELIADSYLSVGSPVQHAAGALLSIGEGISRQILDRVRGNREGLRELLRGTSSCRLLPADGGWCAVLQVPAVQPEEELVLALLGDDDVLVHPGYFFDFPREAFLVLSLLPEPALFREAVTRILRHVA